MFLRGMCVSVPIKVGGCIQRDDKRPSMDDVIEMHATDQFNLSEEG